MFLERLRGESKFMKNTHLKKLGFTLIELLVVIAIIALLLSIVTPALQRAKGHAKSVICGSNQRQTIMAANAYSMENNGANIPSWQQLAAAGVTPEHWYTYIRPYYGDSKKMLHCPAAKRPAIDINNPSGIVGTSKSAWFADPLTHTQNDMDHYGGFGYNNWLEIDFYSLDAAILKNSETSQPARVPVFGDCTWGDAGWVRETDGIPQPDDRDEPHNAPVSGYLKRFCLNRHNDAINLALLDAHVERVDIDDLLMSLLHK